MLSTLLLSPIKALNYFDLLLSPTNTNTIPTAASTGTGHQSCPVFGSVDCTLVVTPVLGVITDLGVTVERGVTVILGVTVVFGVTVGVPVNGVVGVGVIDSVGVGVGVSVGVGVGVFVGVGVGVPASISTFGLAFTS